MNCRQYQAQITDALARGSDPLPTQLAAHADSCSPCREFHAKQRALFYSIDAELQSSVNQPVSPFFLAVVRDRLREETVARRWISPAWSLLAAAATLIIIFGIGHKSRPSLSHLTYTQNSPASSPALVGAKPPQATAKIASIRHAGRSRTRLPTSSARTSEVIVLPEERQALGQFLAAVPDPQLVAVALARPTTPESVDSVEIAPLQIATLEVKPLEGSETE